jgi:uncharacterized membrane protein (UPF0127 family)
MLIIYAISATILFSFLANPQIINSSSSEGQSFINNYKRIPISINGYNISAAIASTDEDKVKGLSGLKELGITEGMLFLFHHASRQGFWMKDMNFPIDIIWIDAMKKVVHIEKELKPCDSISICPVYTPNADALYVLEVNSGFSDQHLISQGATIKFNLNELPNTSK